MKTEKFNRMIEAFECDFALARDDKSCSLSMLQSKISNGDKALLKDIELLEELSWLLRNGKAEIHLVEEN